MDVQVYQEVNKIIETLHGDNWNSHSLQMLVASQGKLAALLANLNEDAAKARKEFDLMETHVKMKEAEMYLENRREGKTENESKALARSKSADGWKAVIEKKNAYTSISGLTEAVITLITACQVTIKNLGKENVYSGHVDN